MKKLSELLWRIMQQGDDPKKKRERRNDLDQVYASLARMLVTPEFHMVEAGAFDGFLFTAIRHVADFELYANSDYLPAKLWLIAAAEGGNAEAKILLDHYRHSVDRLRTVTSEEGKLGVYAREGLLDGPAFCLLRHKNLVDMLVAAFQFNTVHGLPISEACNLSWGSHGAGKWRNVIYTYLLPEDRHLAAKLFSVVDSVEQLSNAAN